MTALIVHLFLWFFRVEAEMIDYSTQYPWAFGVLSILIATGTHPLLGYPTSYEDGTKVRYRSHHLEALPSPDKVRRGDKEFAKRLASMGLCFANSSKIVLLTHQK